MKNAEKKTSLVESAMKKLTNAELRELIKLGMTLESDDQLGLKLLRKLAE